MLGILLVTWEDRQRVANRSRRGSTRFLGRGIDWRCRLRHTAQGNGRLGGSVKGMGDSQVLAGRPRPWRPQTRDECGTDKVGLDLVQLSIIAVAVKNPGQLHDLGLFIDGLDNPVFPCLTRKPVKFR